MRNILLFCFVLLLACNKAVLKDESLVGYCKEIGLHNPEKVLFIHLDGCTSCFLKHRELIQEAKNVGGYQIVLATKSKKKAYLLFGEDLMMDVYFDTDLKAIDLGLIAGFPQLYVFNDNLQLINKLEIEYGPQKIILP